MPSSSDTEEEGHEPFAQFRPHEGADTEHDANVTAAWRAVAAPGQGSVSSLVRVFIESKAHASELYVVNRSYALVAQGVGALDVRLEPGLYKVRQRIGYSELVQNLEVPEEGAVLEMELPPLDFPSPIPLAGTSLVPDKMALRPFSLGVGNFRFILRTPVEAGSLLTAAQAEHMHTEMKRLRLESFDGTLSIPLGDAQPLGEAQSALVFDANLAPGTYVVVQKHHDQRQVCLPVLVLEARTTAVFSLALSDDEEPVPVQLEHAAVAMLRNDERDLPYEESLLRLEAARKAIGAGRRVCGWSSQALTPSAPDLGWPENVILVLLDAQLGWRCLNSRVTDQGKLPPAGERSFMQVNVEGLSDQLDLARSVLGSENADIVALHSALKVKFAEKEVLPLKGPPLLRRSWDQLLSAHEGNTLAASLMTFPFQTEPSPTWFLWSETPGVRAATLARRSEGGRSVEMDSGDLVLSLPSPGGGNVLGDLGLSSGMKIILPLQETLALGLNVMRRLIRQNPVPKKSLQPKQAITVTINDVEAMLAALIQNESFEDWLEKAQMALRAEGKTIIDESMRRLVSSLQALADPTLVDMLGGDVVARQVLATLHLPQNRVIQLVKELLKGIISRLSDSDRMAILAILRNVVVTAEVWVATKTPTKDP